jgi:transcriptional regulator with XRE-family HTH domain
MSLRIANRKFAILCGGMVGGITERDVRTKSVLAQRLSMLRSRADLTQAEVGYFVNVNQGTVSAWENPEVKTTPPAAKLVKLCELYGVSADSLIFEHKAFEEGDSVAAVRKRALSKSPVIRPKRAKPRTQKPTHATTG